MKCQLTRAWLISLSPAVAHLRTTVGEDGSRDPQVTWQLCGLTKAGPNSAMSCDYRGWPSAACGPKTQGRAGLPRQEVGSQPGVLLHLLQNPTKG